MEIMSYTLFMNKEEAHGTINMADGSTTQFFINKDGYKQFGNTAANYKKSVSLVFELESLWRRAGIYL